MVCGCCSVKDEEDEAAVAAASRRRNSSSSPRKQHSFTSATDGSIQYYHHHTSNSPLSAADSPLSRVHVAALASSPPPTLQNMMDRVESNTGSDDAQHADDVISELGMDMGEHEQDVAAVAWLRGRSQEELQEQEQQQQQLNCDEEEDEIKPFPSRGAADEEPDEIIQWEQAHEAEQPKVNSTHGTAAPAAAPALGELHPLDPLHHLQQQQRTTILEAASRKQRGEALMDVSSMNNPGNFSLEQKRQLGFIDKETLKPNNNNNNKNINVSMATAATMESIEVDDLSEIRLERQLAYDDDDDDNDDDGADDASDASLPVDSLVEFSVVNFSPALGAANDINANSNTINFDASRFATGDHYEQNDDDDEEAENVTRIVESSVEESTLVIRRIARHDLEEAAENENGGGAAGGAEVSMMELDKILGFDDQERNAIASPVNSTENEQEKISPASAAAPQTPQRSSLSNTFGGDIDGEATRPNCLQGAASPLFWRSRMRAQEQAQRVQQAQAAALEQQQQEQEQQQQARRALEQVEQAPVPSLPSVSLPHSQLRPPTPVTSNVTFQLPPSPASLNLSPHSINNNSSNNGMDVVEVDAPDSPRNNTNSKLSHRVGGRPSPPPPPPPLPLSLPRVTESTRANAGTASPTIMMTELMASSSSTEQPLPKIHKQPPRVPPTREEEKAARAAAALELSDSQQKQPHPYHHHKHHQDVSISSTSTTASNTNSDESNSPAAVAATTDTGTREDALSNVPSYVDEETKEQYLAACRLLKSTIIHKNSSTSSKNMPLSPSSLTPSSVQEILAQQQQQQQQESTMASPNDQARNLPTTAAMSSTSARSINAVLLEQADSDIFNVESVTSSAFCLSNRGTLEAIKTTLRQKRQTLSAFPNLRLQDRDNNTNRSPPVVSEMTNKVPTRQTLADGLYDEEDEEMTTATGPDIPAYIVSPAPSMVGSTTSDGVASTATSVRDYPFLILGNGNRQLPGVLTPRLMEALRGFFPSHVAGANFWLKFATSNNHKNDVGNSSESSFSSLPMMLDRIYQSKYTVIGVETKEGHVFGSFCSSPWRAKSSWFGSSEAFLWRLKRSRRGNQQVEDSSSTRSQNRRGPNYDFDNEMEIYPCSSEEQIQYCTEKTIAVGGGDWDSDSMNGLNHRPKSPKMNRDPSGIGFMIDGDLMGGETNPCATFNNPRLSLGTGNNTNNRNEFDIVHLEVWTLTPCSTIEDAHAFEEGQDVLGNYAQIRRESLLSTPPPSSLLGEMDLGEV